MIHKGPKLKIFISITNKVVKEERFYFCKITCKMGYWKI